MYWADELVKKIPNKKAKHRVDDMKTVSGMPHVGSLRAVTTHDIVFKAMNDANFNVEFSYVFNDMDPMDGLPVYLNENEYRQHMGKPLYKIPSPEKDYESFGSFYAKKYQEAFNKIGCHPKIIWSHEVYASGKLNQAVRIALDNADKIRSIYKKVAGQDKPKNWHPYQVICPECGKIGTTIVTDWDGKFVTFKCLPNLVEWAKSCGHQGKIEPINENGKLMWKVDWPAHWKVLKVTVEGAGKEHFSEGGSRDIGVHICKEVFKTKPPFGFLHEFFLVGGRKMSSSRGTGLGADKITEIIPPYLVRFLIVRTPLRRAVNFDPNGMTIPDLFDHFDEATRAFWKKKNKKLTRIYELSQLEAKPPQQHFLPRFRDVANYLQLPSINLQNKFEEVKGSKLSVLEKKVLDERIKYAKIWLDEYAPKDFVFSISKKIPKQVTNLTDKQKKFLFEVVNLLSRNWNKPEDFQQALYDKAKDMELPSKRAFEAIYLVLIGKKHGPRAAWLLLKFKKLAQKRLKKVK